jgi:hypothetical protein
MLAFVICIFAISASAAEKVGDFYYSFDEANLTARLTIDNVNFNREDGIADIKSTVEYNGKTYTVVALNDGCFSGSTSSSWPGNKSIKEVYIPETVTYIGKHAFRECINLEKAIVKGNIAYFYDAEFYHCYALKELDMSAVTGLTTIGGYFCQGDSKLTTIKIPSTVTSIGSNAFAQCSSLTSLDFLPSGVTSIGGYAFRDCTSLTDVVIPAGVTKLNDYAFQGCKGLKTFKLPSGLTYLGKNNFQNASKLTEIIIPGTVVQVQNDVFHGSGIKKVIFASENVTSYNGSFFSSTGSLNLIFFPGTKDEAQAMFARDNKIKGWTNFVDYANYDSTQTYTSTIVYNTDLCSNCYDFAPELEVVAKDIVDTINEEAICECGHGTSKKLFDAPIKYLGFSKKIGDNGSICIGYEVNDAALAKYEELTKKTYTYGVVAYIPEKDEDLTTLKPINNDLTLKDEKYTIHAETMGFASFEFIIKGFNTDAEKATMLVMSAYVSDGTSVSYLGINQETNTISQTEFATLVSYNGFVEV